MIIFFVSLLKMSKMDSFVFDSHSNEHSKQ